MKLFRKKEVWMPTRQGLILLLLLIGGLLYGAVQNLYPFLAQNHPVPNAEMIIIEGWLADDELKEAAKAIRPGQIVVTAGGPITVGQEILNYESYAEMTTARLIDFGIPPQNIITCPAPDTQRDRTYVSAKVARRKLEEAGSFGKSADLYTDGAHARRSYLLFRSVFGKDYPLGVIAIAPSNYSQKYWYHSSDGVKSVLTEFIALIYARLFLVFQYA